MQPQDLTLLLSRIMDHGSLENTVKSPQLRLVCLFTGIAKSFDDYIGHCHFLAATYFVFGSSRMVL